MLTVVLLGAVVNAGLKKYNILTYIIMLSHEQGSRNSCEHLAVSEHPWMQGSLERKRCPTGERGKERSAAGVLPWE